jgi:hypothetical protein
LTLNNELKESACCEFQFQPIRNGHPLQMGEWQITSPWKPPSDKSVTGTTFVRRVKMPAQGSHQTSSAKHSGQRPRGAALSSLPLRKFHTDVALLRQRHIELIRYAAKCFNCRQFEYVLVQCRLWWGDVSCQSSCTRSVSQVYQLKRAVRMACSALSW